MNSTSNPSSDRGSGGFFNRLFSWRTFRRILIVLVGLATLAALAWTEENWRGKHDWEQFKQQEEAKGEHFDFAAFVPPPVPDNQNLFMAPIWKGALIPRWKIDPKTGQETRVKTNVADELQMNLYAGQGHGIRGNERPGDWQRGVLTDLGPWQEYFRKVAAQTKLFSVPAQPQTPAADVLFSLRRYDSIIEALRAASRRPAARLPVDYDTPSGGALVLLPVLADLKSCSQVLQLRAVAELDAGENAKALADVQLMLRLNDSIRKPPVLISHLVRIALMTLTLQPVYEGLAEHRWTDAQLATLEAALGKEDYLADYELAMRGERAYGITMMGLSPRYHGLNPFYHQWQLAQARMFQQWILPCVNMDTRVVSPGKVQRLRADEAREWQHATPYNIMAKMAYPALGKVADKFAMSQASVDLARVGCALERYRLAHGQYPDTLAALVPKFIDPLPHDIINGQPLHYQRTADGRFVLYSIGWNDKDDGGHVALTHRGSVDWRKGDWVWQYPAAK